MMKTSRFDRFVIALLAVLAVVFGALLWGGGRIGMAEPELELPEAGRVGAYGPLVLKFRQPVSAAQVEAYLSLEPSVAGKWSWEANQAIFRPAAALQPGTTYTLRLRQGAMDEAGRSLKTEVAWTFSVRAADLIYLGQVNSHPEVWLADGAGTSARPLTDTGGTVRGFAPFPSGEWVVYSSANDQGGADLWMIDRYGENKRQLLDCGTDHCLQPAVAPDESAIIFSRSGETAPQGEIWTLDLVDGQSVALYPDQRVSGIEPDWSPQGRYLQFYDPQAEQIHVLDLEQGKVILIPTSQSGAGSWSPDGERLLFTRAESSEIGLPFVRVYVVELASGDIHLLEAADLGQVDSSLPEYSPDGKSLVMALRGLVSSANKQIWLIPLDGSPNQAITADESASFAACSWDPGGQVLVFQRLQLESSQSTPQVMTWQRASGAFNLVAEDAAWPQWLP